jgi:hypothetical protein
MVGTLMEYSRQVLLLTNSTNQHQREFPNENETIHHIIHAPCRSFTELVY